MLCYLSPAVSARKENRVDQKASRELSGKAKPICVLK